MGIFFDIDEILKAKNVVREFEADGEKSEDDEEYNIDGEGGEDDETGGSGDSSEESGDDGGDDGEPEGEDGGEPAVQNAGDDDEYTIDEPDDGGGSDEGEEGETGDEDPASDDEYTLNDEEGQGEGAEGGGEEGDDTATDDEEYNLDGDNDGDDGGESEEGTGDEGDSSSSEDTESKLKELEGEIFDTLSPEQQQIKIDELKKCYQELYERCDNIIELLNDAKAPDENTSKVFEYVNNSLVDLKQYIYDYFSYTFDTKTYLENNAQYQKHLVVLNSLDDVLKKKRIIKNEKTDKTQNPS